MFRSWSTKHIWTWETQICCYYYTFYKTKHTRAVLKTQKYRVRAWGCFGQHRLFLKLLLILILFNCYNYTRVYHLLMLLQYNLFYNFRNINSSLCVLCFPPPCSPCTENMVKCWISIVTLSLISKSQIK